MDFFKKKKGTGFNFSFIDRTMRERGFTHNRTTIRVYLKFLIDQEKIVNVKTKKRGKHSFYSFYGIPTIRKNLSRYLIITQDIEEEKFEINAVG